METFIGHRTSGSTNAAASASSSNGVGSYTSGYGHSSYGCCCCEKEQGDDGGFLDDQGLLLLLGLGAAAVAFLNMQITMTKKRRSLRRDNVATLEESGSLMYLFNGLFMNGKSHREMQIS